MPPARLAAVLVIALALALPAPAVAQDTPRMGGVLKVASVGEPPTLDIPMSTATIVYEIMWHVHESLFTYDRAFSPTPLLAESHAVSDRGLRHTITLRRGVRFHNGKEMTSADVVPSLKRWGQLASVGKVLWKNVEAIEAKDPYTVVIALKQPSASFLYGLSEPHAAVYPKESIDAAGEGTLKEFIGTGPYRFVEHRPDRHVKLVRFKEYAARSEPPNGFGGKRTAWLDEILFLSVPDTAVRLAGVETGEYHHAVFIKQDAYERIKSLPALESRIVKPRGFAVAVMNHKAGLMTTKKVRQAFQAALDMEPIMAGAMGHKDFYRLDPSLFFPEQPWHSTVSAALYNQRDKDKARRLLKEAGYARQPLRWATTKEYEFMYKTALVARQQLEDVGFVVDLQVLDWASLNARAEKPEQWDVASTGFVFSADPANHVALRCTFWGAWCNEEKERLLGELRSESDPKKRKAIVERLQAIFYEDVGHVKIGDYFTLDAARRELRGDFRTAPRLYFWNSWLAR
ncbi:MAG TPA: ABC transporter substrate-binding protein [Methylomirabilota bacterium]|jgi:peptide/nickel transport system substrate-binding protein|nr:ABC transporter substrate-binding protein [Methylomirabilota bacterium]